MTDLLSGDTFSSTNLNFAPEPFGHKPYIEDCLKELGKWLRRGVRLAEQGDEEPFGTAFYLQTRRYYQDFGKYEASLKGVPAVCLRVPTGGGKTALGARCIKTVRDNFLSGEGGWVLWLVPSTTIRDQTLRQMRDAASPLRQLLDQELGGESGRVLPLDMRSALEISRADANCGTIILVSTLATSRVEVTENRRFYRANGALMAHFENLPSETLAVLERDEDGILVPSLANLLRLHRPLVIVDEAHNSRSGLSLETLGRVAPSAIVELSATPIVADGSRTTKDKAPSNVLHYVFASELKAAQMIKLPLLAREETDWKKCLAEAKAQRENLEVFAGNEGLLTGEFLRPVALIGAERKNETFTIEEVLKVLTEELRVPREHIAIATGEIDEIQGQTVGSYECPIRYVITVDKLREGWDCPSAYVLASVREMRSGTAVEQMVGRVLRMPQARLKQTPELNKSYAFLRSNTTLGAINALKDALVNNGFSRPESEAAIEPQASLPGIDTAWADGKKSVHSQAELNLFTKPLGLRSEARAWRVPTLCLKLEEMGDEVVPLEPDFFLPGDWNINKHPAHLSDAELGVRGDGSSFEIDVAPKGSEATIGFVTFEVAQLDRQLKLLHAENNWKSAADIALWLDRKIQHRDVPHGLMRIWLMNLCSDLVKRFSLRDLEINRMRLRRAVAAKIEEARVKERRVVQKQMFKDYRVDGWGDALWTDALSWKVPAHYAPPHVYNGRFNFYKHAIEGTIGDMNPEEESCAWCLEQHPHVQFWFRNVERQPGSFWLPTASDKFYPDFLALLSNGTTAVVEYKGADRIGDDDTYEKAAMGELWATLTKGQGRFLMVGKETLSQDIGALM